MKTAEEFLVRDELFKTPLTEEEKHYYIDRIITYDDYIKGMIEFAKYHVEKSLEQASNLATKFLYISLSSEEEEEYYKKEILNAYNLENIK